MSKVEPVKLDVTKLTFYRGNESFTREQFADVIAPYMNQLESCGRTRYLCVFQDGANKLLGVTGYRTDETINATINSKCLEAEKSGGRWAVYENTAATPSTGTSDE